MALNYTHMLFSLLSVNAKPEPCYKECDMEAWSGKNCVSLSSCNKHQRLGGFNQKHISHSSEGWAVQAQSKI